MKMRGSQHDADIREFTIGHDGIEVLDTSVCAEAILSGSPHVQSPPSPLDRRPGG